MVLILSAAPPVARTPWLPFQGPIPPVRGKCPEGTKGGRDAVTEGDGEVAANLHRKNPNRKFSLRFGKEEMSTEDKRRRVRRLVPSWSFLTRLRRPLLFRLAGKEGGEKGRLVTVWCILHLNLGKALVFRCRSTRWSPYECLTTRRLIRGIKFVTSYLRTTAVNRRCRPNLLVCTFLRESFMNLQAPGLPLSRGAGAQRLRG